MMAKAKNRSTRRLISKYFTHLKGAETVLKGKDLKLMGFQPGPIYREILNHLLEARLNHTVSTREEEVDFVKDSFGDYLSLEKSQPVPGDQGAD